MNEPLPPDLLFIRDQLNDLDFMIDTGSFRSLLSSNLPSDQAKPKGKMFAANRSEVMLFETVHLIISLGVGCHLHWQFTRANVRFPVIGMDFLQHYGFIVHTVKQMLALDTAFARYFAVQVSRLQCIAVFKKNFFL